MFKHQLACIYNVLSKKIILCILSLNVFLCTLYVINMEYFTINDFVIYSLLGYGQGYFNLTEFLRLIIVNGAPIYIICVLISEETFNNKMLLIRFKSIFISFKKMQINYFVLIVIYIFIQISFAYLFGSIFGVDLNDYIYIKEFSEYNLNGFNYINLLFSALILRLVELMFLQILLISCYCVLKNSVMSFMITMGTYIFLLFTSNKFFPLGISSISRFIELDSHLQIAFLKAISVLILSYSSCYIYIYIKGYKTLYD